MGRRGAAGVGIAALAQAVAIAACSLGDFSSYSDGDEQPDVGSPDAPPTTDGGSDGGDASATTNDAGVEAGPRFCEANGDAGFFCEDFEGPSPLLHFDSVKTIGGTLVVEQGTMVAEAPAGTAEAYAHGSVSANVTGSHARISFSVKPEVLNTTTANANQMAKIYFIAAGKPSYEVGVGLHGAGSSAVYAYEYTSGGAYKEFGDLPSLAANRMTRFVLDVDISGDANVGARIDLDRDGVRVVDGAPLAPSVAAGAVYFFIGFPYVPPNHGAWKLRFDDVLMERFP